LGNPVNLSGFFAGSSLFAFPINFDSTMKECLRGMMAGVQNFEPLRIPHGLSLRIDPILV
jgi:hypothetical protein